LEEGIFPLVRIKTNKTKLKIFQMTITKEETRQKMSTLQKILSLQKKPWVEAHQETHFAMRNSLKPDQDLLP
tara:strand:- start:408 stop:623 length:216 start_codon:yes stop_codon:yes gene_type:complete